MSTGAESGRSPGRWPTRDEIDLITRIARKAARKTCQRITLTIDRIELANDATSELVRRFPTAYKPERASVSTWATRAAHDTCIDLARRNLRQQHQAAPIDSINPAQLRASVYTPAEDVAPDLPIDEWVSCHYRNAIRNVGTSRVAPGPAVNPAQRVTLYALKQRLNSSIRGLQNLLETNERLRRSLQLHAVPGVRKIHEICCELRCVNSDNKVHGGEKPLKTDWITERQAALLIGWSYHTLKRRRLARKMPVRYYRPGGIIRYSKKEVVAYVKSTAVQPVEPTAA